MNSNRFGRAILSTSLVMILAVAAAQAAPTLFDPNLAVRTAVQGLVTPVSLAFPDDDEMFVLEKNTGKVQWVADGNVTTVLDLAVNFASERGLLGIALHPEFATNGFVYLYWTESTTGVDSGVLSDTPLLGNRVDRFVWNGSSLVMDLNIIRLRALQPPNPPLETREAGNHDGGVLRFGPDGKLYLVIGDNGRRGWLQNLENGPVGAGQPDDQFGGPAPDDAHLTGVILRLEDDGTTPPDNPFFAAGAAIGGEVGENIQKIFAYGIRNSFGFDFDPASGGLWIQVNGDDSFDELDRMEPGANGGWIQVMGPASRVAQFKAIETDTVTVDPVTNQKYFGLQQARWSPRNIADTPEEALSRLFVIAGSHYSDPEFSWKFAVAPAGIGFLTSRSLGPQYQNDLFVAASRPFLEGGYLFRFNLTGNRRNIAVDDPRLADGVADNQHKFDIEESESLLFGRGFGIGTDVKTGPNGNLYVVSLTDGAVYEIFRRNTRPTDDPDDVQSVETQGPVLTADVSPSFSQTTTIHLQTSTGGLTTLRVFNAAGRHVTTLVDRILEAGRHAVVWDGRDAGGAESPSGVYFVRIEGAGETVVLRTVRLH